MRTMKTSNNQQPTTNNQVQRIWAFIGCSMLNVGSWMFLSLLIAALPLHAEQVTNSPAPVAAPAERLLDQSELILMLTQTLQQDYVKDRGELELRITQNWTSKKVSDEPLTVKILEMPTIGVTPSFI